MFQKQYTYTTVQITVFIILNSLHYICFGVYTEIQILVPRSSSLRATIITRAEVRDI